MVFWKHRQPKPLPMLHFESLGTPPKPLPISPASLPFILEAVAPHPDSSQPNVSLFTFDQKFWRFLLFGSLSRLLACHDRVSGLQVGEQVAKEHLKKNLTPKI